jgi:hypothetical protein
MGQATHRPQGPRMAVAVRRIAETERPVRGWYHSKAKALTPELTITTYCLPFRPM